VLTVTPPGDRFKDCRLEGEMSKEEVKQLTEALGADLYERAQKSGLTVPDKPKDDIRERPLYVHYAISPADGWVQPWSLRGAYFAYSQGKIQGAVDVIAARTKPDNPKWWVVVCAVHERAP
jgi:hypothetical protein